MLNGDNPLCYRTLKKRKRNKDDPPVQKPTHTCMDGDTIYVHPEETHVFLRNYAEDVMENGPVRYYISELNGTLASDIVRVWFELDLKHENLNIIDQVNKNFTKTDHFIGTLCGHLISLVRQCFPKHTMHISVIADKRYDCNSSLGLSLGSSSGLSSSSSSKTGVHLHVPEIFVTIKDLAKLRNVFVNILDKEMDLRRWGFNDVTWDSVIDAAPIAVMKGLRLPGSYKCSACAPECKKTSCNRCNGNLYVGSDNYYWPCAWFYEPVRSDASNRTSFPGAEKVTGYTCLSLEGSNLTKTIFNVSVKTNGPVIALHEEQLEVPCKFRKTATIGFEVATSTVIKQQKKAISTQKPAKESLAHGFLTPIFEFSAGSDYVTEVQNAVRRACCASFASFLSSKKVLTFKHEKSASGDSHALKLQDLIRKHKQTGDETIGTTKVDKLYQQIEIGSVKAGMIKNNKKIYEQVTKLLPITVTGGVLCKTFMRMPYVLVIYICPFKNDASKHCLFKGESHSQNNVYFQTFFPVMTQSMREFEDGDDPEWSTENMARWIAMLVNSISTDQVGMPSWPLFLRCYSKQNCEGKQFAFSLSWTDLLDILEPMISQILLTNKLKLNEKRLVV